MKKTIVFCNFYLEYIFFKLSAYKQILKKKNNCILYVTCRVPADFLGDLMIY